MRSPSVSDDNPAVGPVRTCIGCRRRAAKSELLRVTAGSGAQDRAVLVPDPKGTAPGRGAHLHPTSGCYDLAVRRKAFSRALRLKQGAVKLSSVPVAEYLAQITPIRPTEPTRDWSSSS
ncbi:MAG: YlxR family protein [Nocardioidaceae bacterium]|nr:YlxR family protein [Nocardioidaceae bacterium]